MKKTCLTTDHQPNSTFFALSQEVDKSTPSENEKSNELSIITTWSILKRYFYIA
ncbi:TPA_asm: hypothetical protein [Psilorhabdovirus 1]|nr:TPA_asm: hypothetical protein [Psilorhabdovirus 1]